MPALLYFKVFLRGTIITAILFCFMQPRPLSASPLCHLAFINHPSSENLEKALVSGIDNERLYRVLGLGRAGRSIERLLKKQNIRTIADFVIIQAPPSAAQKRQGIKTNWVNTADGKLSIKIHTEIKGDTLWVNASSIKIKDEIGTTVSPIGAVAPNSLAFRDALIGVIIGSFQRALLEKDIQQVAVRVVRSGNGLASRTYLSLGFQPYTEDLRPLDLADLNFVTSIGTYRDGTPWLKENGDQWDVELLDPAVDFIAVYQLD